ncbi:hypothetical protein QH494_28430 [Sphingomonas sp. AR_OL41]|uniref:hypothetical protein n=1 Tax=Sphingomonas sp. AR_OL41 TaxID=3042729 RepID=UPI00248056A8|nr:hypothetical protein [Sphingomonas sp. AR_OL41]MDH7976119.1 hypothetical protein [Sphingomonas sp. AR_OL41]
MIFDLGAVRDLIEAGLSEPADAATRYGISVARPVPGDWFWVGRCTRTGGGDADPPVLVEAIDAPFGILGWVAGWAPAQRVDRQDAGHGASLRPSRLMS